jgi:hypothetical protein
MFLLATTPGHGGDGRPARGNSGPAGRDAGKKQERVERLPFDRIVGEDRQVLGYLQIEIHGVHLPGEKNVQPVRVRVVFDRSWKRRGFITEDGLPYAYTADGKPQVLDVRDFYEAIRVMLDLEMDIRVEKYTGDPGSAASKGETGKPADPVRKDAANGQKSSRTSDAKPAPAEKKDAPGGVKGDTKGDAPGDRSAAPD